MSDLRTAAQQMLEALEGGADSWQLVGPAIDALKEALVEDAMQKFTDVNQEIEAALAEPEPCRYPDCVDNEPDGKCMRWLLAECSKSEDYNPKRPAEMVRAGAAKSVHDKAYSEVELADAYQKGWSDAMLRRSLGPHIIKE